MAMYCNITKATLLAISFTLLIGGTVLPACAVGKSLKEQMQEAEQRTSTVQEPDQGQAAQTQKYTSGNQLIDAIIYKDINQLRSLIKQGANVNSVNEQMETPLHIAVRGFNVDAVKLLLAHGASVNARDFNNRTPLLSIAEDHTSRSDAEVLAIVRLLVEKGADVNADDIYEKTFLQQAYKKRFMDVVYFLLQNGAKPNIKTSSMSYDNSSILNMVADAPPEIFEYNFKRSAPESTFPAKLKDQVAFATFLLDKGADVNSLGSTFYHHKQYRNPFTGTPLLMAINNNNKPLVDLFISRGARFQLQDPQGHSIPNPIDVAIATGNLDMVKYLVAKKIKFSKTTSNLSSLSLAIRLNHPDIVRFLLEQGADINEKGVKEHGEETPIFYALRNQGGKGDLDLVEYMVEHGAALNVHGMSGMTPLHVAVSQRVDINIIKYLIDKDSNINSATDFDKKTIIQTACKNRLTEVVALLVEKGAIVQDRANPCASF